MRRLLCSVEGIIINDVIITKDIIENWLRQIPNTNWSDNSETAIYIRIKHLLNPKDAQDVPAAIQLLSLTSEL